MQDQAQAQQFAQSVAAMLQQQNSAETVQIPNGPEVNFLIGKAGATINSLEMESGCKLAVQKANEVMPGVNTRTVTVNGGDPARRARAVALINAKVMEYHSTAGSSSSAIAAAANSVGDGETVAIEIPNGPEVNFVIGKQGSTINALQYETGCKIAVQRIEHVARGAPSRTVTISLGDAAGRARCAQLVLNKVAEYRTQSGGGAPANPSQGGQQSGDQLIITIPNGPEVNYVIGPKGSTISGLEMECGCKIAVQRTEECQPGAPTRVVTIHGGEEMNRARCAQLVMAKAAEYQLVVSNQHMSGAGGASSTQLAQMIIEIPNGPEVNFVIGKQGSTINALQSDTGCKIAVQRTEETVPGAPMRTVTISGASDAQVALAAQLVNSKVLQYAHQASTGGSHSSAAAPAGHGSTAIQIPNGPEVNFVIGKGGATIRELEMASGCKIAVQRQEEVEHGAATRTITIVASDEPRRNHCAQLIFAKVAEYGVVESGGGDQHAAKRMRAAPPGGAYPGAYGAAPLNYGYPSAGMPQAVMPAYPAPAGSWDPAWGAPPDFGMPGGMPYMAPITGAAPGYPAYPPPRS